MMPQINIATEASDSNIPFVRTSVHTFIKNNQWFRGTLFLLTSHESPISSANLSSIKAIYGNISIIQSSQFDKLSNFIKSNIKLIGPQNVINFLKYSIFFKELDSPIFYFNSKSLFIKDISENFIDSGTKLDDKLNYIYLTPSNPIDLTSIDTYQYSGEFNFASWILDKVEPKNYFLENFYTDSSNYPDQKFKQLSGKLTYFNAILFNNLNNQHLARVNQIWLQKNKEAALLIAKPSSVKNNLNTFSNLKKVTNNIQNVTQYNFTRDSLVSQKVISEYLDNKKIAIVANSSELLDYSYGELIDSHDIVIRFNGYKILSNHTGSKTNIHCIFREVTTNLNLNSDYLLVISKPVFPWENTLSKLKIQYSTKKIINYNFPTDSQILSSFGKTIIPTSGLCSVLFIDSLNLSKYEISLFGFNGYSGGTSSILRSDSSTNISTVHKYAIEVGYLKKTFNQVLPGVLQKIKI